MVRTPRVEAAMRAVPRHVFLPGVPLHRAYANDVVQTKHDPAGMPISAASQPSIVGAMLDQLAVEPGMRVLEVGAGTGYNAALLAYLAGAGGRVVTVDVDDDIVAGARAALARFATGRSAKEGTRTDGAGIADVTVLRGDGALGCPEFAPYDRIIATVGTWDLPLAWQEQLAPDGRLVVPLRLRGGVTRSIAFVPSPGGEGLQSISSEMCGFMPLRASVASDPRRVIPLTPPGDVTLEVQQDQTADAAALTGVLDTEPGTVWTGVSLRDAQSADGLSLWLTCTVPGGMFGMSARPAAVERGIVTPMFRWGAVAAVDSGSLAYLTLGPPEQTEAPGDPEAPGGSGGPGTMREIGVVGHGAHGQDLARVVVGQVHQWAREYQSRTPSFTVTPLGSARAAGEYMTGEFAAGEFAPGEFVFRTPSNLLVITWQ